MSVCEVLTAVFAALLCDKDLAPRSSTKSIAAFEDRAAFERRAPRPSIKSLISLEGREGRDFNFAEWFARSRPSNSCARAIYNYSGSLVRHCYTMGRAQAFDIALVFLA
jgi:hypothetical protein